MLLKVQLETFALDGPQIEPTMPKKRGRIRTSNEIQLQLGGENSIDRSDLNDKGSSSANAPPRERVQRGHKLHDVLRNAGFRAGRPTRHDPQGDQPQEGSHQEYFVCRARHLRRLVQGQGARR